MRRRTFVAGGVLAAGGAATGAYLYLSTMGTPADRALREVVSKLAELPGAVRLGRKLAEIMRADGSSIPEGGGGNDRGDIIQDVCVHRINNQG